MLETMDIIKIHEEILDKKLNDYKTEIIKELKKELLNLQLEINALKREIADMKRL
ncbi:hypothetical protein KBH77_04560 [Patescibacteria group bacterium]|nr:hypothetical protein [Patescibacteria group bacterium]